MEVAAQVRPACRLAELDGAIWASVVQLGIALVAVGLEDPLGLLKVLADVFFLPVRGEAVEVLSRKLWKFRGGALRACEGSVFQAARSRCIGSMG